MRRAALAVLAASGCNQIWDLDPAELRPDGPPSGRITLQRQLSLTTATGALDPDLAYEVLSPAPRMQVARLDGTACDTEGHELCDVEYDAEGGAKIDANLYSGAWRVIYTLADGVPREVQLPALLREPHLVVPQLGRTARDPIPDGSGYTIAVEAPPGPTMSQLAPSTRVFTTGMWSDSGFVGLRAGALDAELAAHAVPFEGALGAPRETENDRGLLVDYYVDTQPALERSCRVAVGVVSFTVPALEQGTLSAPSQGLEYVSTSQAATSVSLAISTMHKALPTRLPALVPPSAPPPAPDDRIPSFRWIYGYLASSGFGFVKPPSGVFGDITQPSPYQIGLVSCSHNAIFATESPLYVDDPTLSRAFPRAVYFEYVLTRTTATGGLPLSSGITGVVDVPVGTATAIINVAAPRDFELRQGGAPVADLFDEADGAPVSLAGGPLELAFGRETSPGTETDYFEVLLYDVSAGTLALVASFTSTSASISIDPAYLTPETEYVFEVRAYRGRPDAELYDFRRNTYPQYAANIFTRTFVAKP